MIKQIKKIEPLVEELLVKHPSLRDNDNSLYLNLLVEIDRGLLDQSFKVFASRMTVGEFPAMESVTRARRKIQGDREELRGKKFINRMKKRLIYI